MSELRSAEPIAEQIAELIHEGFDTFYEEFKRLTRESRQSFDTAAWSTLHEESHRRIDLYQEFVGRTLRVLEPWTTRYPQDQEVWKAAHIHYAEITQHRVDREVAKTFFNAITRKIFRTEGVQPQIEFLDDHFECESPELPGQFHRFPFRADLETLAKEILRRPRPALKWSRLDEDARYVAGRLSAYLAHCGGTCEAIDIVRAFFFRVREGYIVGRLRRGGAYRPFLIPVQVDPRGAVVDGVIFTLEETLQVFSSTRAYMFVDVHKPSDLVRFLSALMPEQTLSELYVGIAHHRHGKTLIYREMVEHLERSDDKFIVAPGIKGLVMTVFTMPSYRNVFKIIRDDFEKPEATRERILQSYRDVFRGRRVGRLADTQEFEHLAFARDRFTAECLAELLSKASSTVRCVGDEVVISHCYIEEKMIPFNLFLQTATVEQAKAAFIDYGHAIKELAASNIFAGDLLWKNFGVTRNGRLVLYDYDEIQPLLECNFRRIPPPRSYEEEMSATPYFAVDDCDVFPEEWRPFVVPRSPPLQEAFLSEHADLLTPEYWRRQQRRVLAGQLHIGLPYSSRHPQLQPLAARGAWIDLDES